MKSCTKISLILAQNGNPWTKCLIHHFGGCFVRFLESFLRLGRSKSHFLSLEKGHFGQKCPYSSDKKWDFECPNLRIDSGNPAKHPPKWWGRHLFHVFTIFGQVLSKFSNLLILANFGPFSHVKRAKTRFGWKGTQKWLGGLVFWPQHLQMGPTKVFWGPMKPTFKFGNVYPPLLLLSWYHHQPESHQQSFTKSRTYVCTPGPIDRTPETPGSGKKEDQSGRIMRSNGLLAPTGALVRGG